MAETSIVEMVRKAATWAYDELELMTVYSPTGFPTIGMGTEGKKGIVCVVYPTGLVIFSNWEPDARMRSACNVLHAEYGPRALARMRAYLIDQVDEAVWQCGGRLARRQRMHATMPDGLPWPRLKGCHYRSANAMHGYNRQHFFWGDVPGASCPLTRLPGNHTLWRFMPPVIVKEVPFALVQPVPAKGRARRKVAA